MRSAITWRKRVRLMAAASGADSSAEAALRFAAWLGAPAAEGFPAVATLAGVAAAVLAWVAGAAALAALAAEGVERAAACVGAGPASAADPAAEDEEPPGSEPASTKPGGREALAPDAGALWSEPSVEVLSEAPG